MTKQILFLIILSVFFNSGCTEVNKMENLLGKMETLRKENDSLKNILEEISHKYVFDSLTIRDIASPENSFKLNSNIKGEIVLVGYNGGDFETSAILADSITFENGEKLYNPDTLK